MVDMKEFHYEQERLKHVFEEIRKQLDEKRKTINDYKENIIKLRKSMWDETSHSPEEYQEVYAIQQYLHNLKSEEEKHSLYYNQVRKMEEALEKPYFARVDFQEEKEDIEEIYIGLSTLFHEDTNDILIYDWRAPIASIYYDFDVGPAFYDCPAGEIKGDISLKRQFKIANSKIEYIFDSNIKIDDEILQEILSKSVDDKMKNIVATIQKEQNKVIRDTNNNFLMVQGVAGSGKTSIALHRIAYLLYRYRNQNIGSRNIVVFSPNQIFNDYISNVLPELGEDNMEQTTFYEYVTKTLGSEYIIQDFNDQMEYIFTRYNEQDYVQKIQTIRYKASQSFLDVIKGYVKYLEKEKVKFNDIEYRGEVIFTKRELDELFHDGYKDFPVITRLRKIRRRIYDTLKPLQKARLKEIQEEIKFEVDFEHEIKPLSRLRRLKEFKPLINNIEDMTYLDIIESYKGLFKGSELMKRLSKNTNFDSCFDFMQKHTVDSIENKHIHYEDVSPLLLLKVELEGNLSLYHIKHVVIDEAQDYNTFQYEIFKLLFNKSNITILGDLNQSISPFVDSWKYDNVKDIFGLSDSVLIELKTSYRSTKEIFSFTRGILLEKADIRVIDRSGNKPKVIGLESDSEMIEAIVQGIEKAKNKGYKSVAVICKTARDSIDVYSNLKDRVDIELMNSDDIKLKRGNVVIPSYLAKGLEFDSVLVYDASKDKYHRENERKLFYTICTRALHDLKIYYIEQLTPFLKNVDSELYECK